MKISIIVPVYKAEKHLAATLDSLIGQTHKDLEIICVNDGSPDGCARILDDYAARDTRIEVINQTNQGVSIARNAGMAAATGDILMFVDADDTLRPFACERVAEIFAQKNPDVLTFGLECDPPEAAPASLRRELAPTDKIYDGFESALLFEEYARPYACRTALSATFARRENIRFEPGLGLAEDQVFYFAAYPFARRTVLSSEKLYVYRMNDESATHAAFDGQTALRKKLDAHLTAIEAICRIWDERDMREFCAPELLEWCLDFTMLDIGKLPVTEQRAFYARLLACLDGHFERPCEHFATKRITKACLADIRAGLEEFAQAKEGGLRKTSDLHSTASEDNSPSGTERRIDTGTKNDAPGTAGATDGPNTPSDDPIVKPFHKAHYYLMRRGFARCAERVLMKLGIVK
ncbi:MAG: glycosyltransferase [Slackia sp.]|nr:glycosyltransferase [Slackia sp.]